MFLWWRRQWLVLVKLQEKVIMEHFHAFSRVFRDLIEILTNLHLLALLIINVTKTPKDALPAQASYTSVNRIYRIIEFLAGLITPLAKK